MSTFTSHDGPREKLSRVGLHALTDAELLALLLRTGVQQTNVVNYSQQLLQEIGGWRGLQRCTLESLLVFRGLGLARASSVIAACEIGRRCNESVAPVVTSIASSHDIFLRYHAKLRGQPREEVIALALDRKHRILRERWLGSGDCLHAPVSVRELFTTALAAHAHALVLVHNHPSGDPQPSHEDALLTTHIAMIGQMLELPLLDHVIIGDAHYYSFRDHGGLNVDATTALRPISDDRKSNSSV